MATLPVSTPTAIFPPANTGYDFATLGNHEFDYKIPQLTKLTKQAKLP